VPCFLLLLQPLLHFGFVLLDRVFRRCTTSAKDSLLLATLTDLPRNNAELVAENALLRQQLAILQRKVKHPQLKRSDRFWLLVWASRVAHWKQALVIIQPDTLLRWHREGFRLFWKHTSTPKAAQPKVSLETIALIKQMARENRLWGAERIRGELLKLGIHVAKGTVQRYMRGVRSPREPNQNWSTFVKTNVKDVWACDFLPVVDLWFRTGFVFFIIELESRWVVHFGVTRHPTEAWVAQPLREATPNAVGPKYLIRDNDSKFGGQFDRVANAICERFLGSVRRECLDHLLIFTDGQLYRVIHEYAEYFNRARPHQGIGQRIPAGDRVDAEVSTQSKLITFPGMKDLEGNPKQSEQTNGEKKGPPARGKIVAFPVLNGLHHNYRRVA
jgi:putative transposase